MGSHERKLAHTTNVGETSLNNNGKSRNYMFIPNPLLWHGVREYSAAANHNSRYHVRRPNERQTNGRKYPFVILISKARCFISFSPETINFREHATQSQSRALSTCTHHTPTPPPSDTTARRPAGGDDDKTCFLEPSCSATPNASASQCSWLCETIAAITYVLQA